MEKRSLEWLFYALNYLACVPRIVCKRIVFLGILGQNLLEKWYCICEAVRRMAAEKTGRASIFRVAEMTCNTSENLMENDSWNIAN